MSQLSGFISDALNEIAITEGFVAHKIEVQSGSNNGDGSIGVLISVVINGAREQNGLTSLDNKLSLLCKTVPMHVTRRKEFHTDVLFEREAFMYSTVLPLFAEFQREKGLTDADHFTFYPKCFKTISNVETDELVIIMEDLRPKGFTMLSRDKIVSPKHAHLIVESLAKMHAVSFAMKDQRPIEFAKLKELKDLLRIFFKSEAMLKYMYVGCDRALKALKNPKHRQIVEVIKANPLPYFEKCLNDDASEPFGVIGHSDCWINNILFRHENETNEPVDICFIDWQLSCYSSPVLDLHYLISSATDKAFRHKEYQILMKHYHHSLSEAICRLGSDPEKLFSYVDFENELKKLGSFVLLMATYAMEMILANAEDIPDLDELSEELANDGKHMNLYGVMSDEQNREYDQRMNDLFDDFIEMGFCKDLE